MAEKELESPVGFDSVISKSESGICSTEYMYLCIYINIYMAVSHLFLHIELPPVVPLVWCMSFVEIQTMLCAGLSLCHVRDKVCVMCGFESVFCAGFSLCYLGT